MQCPESHQKSRSSANKIAVIYALWFAVCYLLADHIDYLDLTLLKTVAEGFLIVYAIAGGFVVFAYLQTVAVLLNLASALVFVLFVYSAVYDSIYQVMVFAYSEINSFLLCLDVIVLAGMVICGFTRRSSVN